MNRFNLQIEAEYKNPRKTFTESRGAMYQDFFPFRGFNWILRHNFRKMLSSTDKYSSIITSCPLAKSAKTYGKISHTIIISVNTNNMSSSISFFAEAKCPTAVFRYVLYACHFSSPPYINFRYKHIIHYIPRQNKNSGTA